LYRSEPLTPNRVRHRVALSFAALIQPVMGVRVPTLSELIGRDITPETKSHHTPKVDSLSAPLKPNTEKAHGQYEAEVFNFLLANKEQLGIKDVVKFTALLVDGAVELIDGRRLAVEVKYRMNWEKACQAEWQFRTAMKRTTVWPFPVAGGIVIFEEFSGDWLLQPARRLLENGWNQWYSGHAEVDGGRLDLLRFRNEKMEGFPIGCAGDAPPVDERVVTRSAAH
jgi:hypothetical protein